VGLRREIYVGEYDGVLGTAALASPEIASRYSIDGKRANRIVKFVEIRDAERVIDVETIDYTIGFLEALEAGLYDPREKSKAKDLLALYIDKLKRLRDEPEKT
jgi:hypothetical protein